MTVGAWTSLAIGLVLTGVGVLLFVETYLLATGREPITWHARIFIIQYPHVAWPIMALVAFVVGLLTAHFGWDACVNWSGACD